MSEDDDRTASLMTPARLAKMKVQPRAAASPADWLNQMAADAGSGHVRRLLDLRRQLEEQLQADEGEALADAATALGQAIDAVDPALVQPRGWLARATGKGKEAAAVLAGQAQRAVLAAEDFADEVRQAQRKLPAQAAATDRGLLEMEVELRAIEKIIDQASRWLQDMRNQLKARTAEGGGPEVQQQIQADTARCELLVARTKLLRAASSATQHALESCRSLAGGRSAWLAAAQGLAEGEAARCRQELSSLAGDAEGSGSPGVDSARAAQAALQPALRRLAQEGGAVQAQRRAAIEQVAAAEAPLQAAG